MSELDDIERVLDHAEKPWKLTDEEWDLLLGWPSVEPTKQQRAIATAAVKKYQEWLVEKCGPNPCEGCQDKIAPCRGRGYEQYEQYDCVGKIPENIEHHEYACDPYAVYQGQQQGYAKAMQERGK